MENSSEGDLYDGPDDERQEAPVKAPPRGAPRYSIPKRKLGAVEIPAIVNDVDRAVKAFGRVPTLNHTLDPERHAIPLYLNPESPFCKPLMSHNARTHNVVLKVTVPKRTGRKRKQGTSSPWEGDVEIGDTENQVCSRSRLDDPNLLRKKLQDNVGKYHVEAVGVIGHTHRFRGLADFYWDLGSKSEFAKKYAEQVLPGDGMYTNQEFFLLLSNGCLVQQLRQFKFTPEIDKGPNVDVIPPPVFTHMSLPFNYAYSQNPYVRTTADGETFNATAVKHVGYFIAAEDPTPTGPQVEPDLTDPRMVEVLAELETAFADRPVWTRRALMNHLGGKLRNWNELKKYLNYAAYQFKGGPWRDGVVPYGVDPRTDPKFRIYQTLMFKLLPKHVRVQKGYRTWRSLHYSQNRLPDSSESHVFNGDTYHTDGKVWQVCDITDPLLSKLLANAAIRPERDANSGFYHGGLWAKVKAIMKTKLVAIQFGRELTEEDFTPTLQSGDQTPIRTGASTSIMPLPNLNLTNEELTLLRGREPTKKNKNKGYSVRVREPGRLESLETEQNTAPDSGPSQEMEWYQEDGQGAAWLQDDDDEGSESEEEEAGDYSEYPNVPDFEGDIMDDEAIDPNLEEW